MSDHYRRFSRIPFDAHVSLHQDNWHAHGQLIDISLHGLLLRQPDTWSQVDISQPLRAVVELSSTDQIHMEVQQVFARNGLLGLECRHIDLDSISHLKRLVVLNLGDDVLAERELTALCAEPHTDP
ncbi:PilZ domain-containing protein [Pseudomonas sp. MYb185]|uniref:PilZ domain-containing protein n=1 Tax=Pseudomonas sp. MYb185 TaxID=1848729 RepID=UPI000CFD495F|nr:PilZ domain-containing protein [Pseudomonas sp. MYb185]PRB84083.1 PilZ domain-containing protein [Pseudomonas sp. MYb185]